MKIYLGILLFLLNNLSYSQTIINEKNEGRVILNIACNDSVNLYQSYNSNKILKKIAHNFVNEDYIYLEILETKNDMYYVNANYFINGFIAKGWVKKGNPCFGVYSKAYSEQLILFDKPNKSSKKYILKKYDPIFYRVFDCYNKWLLVEFTLEGKKHKAWIDPLMQCNNPYTNCN